MANTEKSSSPKRKFSLSGTGFLLLITIGLFIAMYAAGMIVFADKGFAKPQMFFNLFITNAGLLVISMGLTIVMISGGIDISVGSVTALVCMAVAYTMENMGVSAYVSVLIALGIGLAYGLVQGFLVAYLEIQPFIVTLAGLFFGRGMTAVISKEMISIKNEVFLAWANYKIYLPVGSYSKRGKFLPAYIYPTVVIAIIILIVIIIVMKFTKFGRSVYAVGGNTQSAMMMGLNVRRIRLKAYILDGLLAGCGGFLFSVHLKLSAVRAIYGADKPDSGKLKVNGKEVKINTPLDAMKLGMAYLPEDRKKDGIIADLSVRENIIIALQAKRGMFKLMSRKEMEEAADKYIDILQVKTASRETPIKSLSGGNQQKVIIGRWLLTNPEYLILDEPTRGIDIGTKTEIQKLVLDLADDGMAVTFISSEVEEMLRTCSRMGVLRDGRKVGEITGDELTQEGIMKAIAGGEGDE